MPAFQLTCCSTSDLPKEYYETRNIPVVYFRYILDGETHYDDFGQTIPLNEFYKRMEEGSSPTTSQVNMSEYITFFEPILRRGEDILHLSLTSGISGSYNSAKLAETELRGRYPERKIIVIDTLAASSGYGLLLDKAADLRDEGKSIDEVAEWVETNKLRIHHWFFTSELKYLQRGGRISATAARFGSLLNICPLMNVSHDGFLTPRAKIRGKKHVAAEAVERMKALADDRLNYTGKVFLCNSAVPDEARELASLVESTFPKMDGKVKICDIGTVIGAHTGPGTLSIFFWGDPRVD
ncbi:MAG: DegV family protein [Oscillospiraceae bacterium]|jgi:DegV family protein with EDD domain|nr:DegV family protein [Oscillospiraceae bacterium]